ncbi:MAG: hypothetical protein GVY15_01815 [Bacteroidetes bacterium]|jgi:hypothetical protein|nr:hypothetical protein [Bacteroidota bacterium]
MLNALHASIGAGGTFAALILGFVVFLFWPPGIARLVTSDRSIWTKSVGVLALGLFPPLVLLLWGAWWLRAAFVCPPYVENCSTPSARFLRWYRVQTQRLLRRS